MRLTPVVEWVKHNRGSTGPATPGDQDRRRDADAHVCVPVDGTTHEGGRDYRPQRCAGSAAHTGARRAPPPGADAAISWTASKFEAAFFAVRDDEATAMDPQQRLALLTPPQ
ncbi:beta-ketoacyl synthase N-terminal-like domain-containing protein [Streptomyces sp. NPDC001272]